MTRKIFAYRSKQGVTSASQPQATRLQQPGTRFCSPGEAVHSWFSHLFTFQTKRDNMPGYDPLFLIHPSPWHGLLSPCTPARRAPPPPHNASSTLRANRAPFAEAFEQEPCLLNRLQDALEEEAHLLRRWVCPGLTSLSPYAFSYGASFCGSLIDLWSVGRRC